ncbi:MAG: RHS repeat-associated core domain-containing protein, partial [Terriglobales bacterium]
SGELYAGGRHLAIYAYGTTYFKHIDWLGDERAWTGMGASDAGKCSNLPFGDNLACSNGSLVGPFHFTGQYLDPESGLDYFQARHYAASQGRFVSPDPAGLAAVNPNNPQSWNSYAYVGGNPLEATDPLGLKAVQPCPQDGACDWGEQDCTLDGMAEDCGNLQTWAGMGAAIFVCNGCPSSGVFYSPVNHEPYRLADWGEDGLMFTSEIGNEVSWADATWGELGLPDPRDDSAYEYQALQESRLASLVPQRTGPPRLEARPAPPTTAQMINSTAYSRSYAAFLACEYGHTLGDENEAEAWASVNGLTLIAILSGNLKAAVSGLFLSTLFDVGGAEAINAGCSAATYGR